MSIHKILLNGKSITETVLAGLGMSVLYRFVTGIAAGLTHVLGANGYNTLGFASSAVLTAARMVHACPLDHRPFAQGLMQQMLLAVLPVVLVTTREPFLCRILHRGSEKIKK